MVFSLKNLLRYRVSCFDFSHFFCFFGSISFEYFLTSIVCFLQSSIQQNYQFFFAFWPLSNICNLFWLFFFDLHGALSLVTGHITFVPYPPSHHTYPNVDYICIQNRPTILNRIKLKINPVRSVSLLGGGGK